MLDAAGLLGVFLFALSAYSMFRVGWNGLITFGFLIDLYPDHAYKAAGCTGALMIPLAILAWVGLKIARIV